MKQNPIKESLAMVLRGCSRESVGFLVTMVALVIATAGSAVAAPDEGGAPVPVTTKNFQRAETDMYFAKAVKNGANCIVTPPGWNCSARQYRPRKEVVDGTWKFPEAQPVR